MKITLHSTATCDKCIDLKTWLTDNGYDFETHDMGFHCMLNGISEDWRADGSVDIVAGYAYHGQNISTPEPYIEAGEEIYRLGYFEHAKKHIKNNCVGRKPEDTRHSDISRRINNFAKENGLNVNQEQKAKILDNNGNCTCIVATRCPCGKALQFVRDLGNCVCGLLVKE